MSHLALCLESVAALRTSGNRAISRYLFTLRILRPGKSQVVYRFHYSKLNFRKLVVTKLLKSR